jgi:hypothetical protein
MSLPAAVQLLAQQGLLALPDDLSTQRISDYLRDYSDYRQRLQQVWQQAQYWLCYSCSPDLNRLRARLRLGSHLAAEQWRCGPGLLLGGLPHEHFEACFCPHSTGQGGAAPSQRYLLNPSRGRVFSGAGWGDVLAIAYHDLPGRIAAFELIGRQGERGDRVFRPQRLLARAGSNQHGRRPPLRAEAGLAGLPGLAETLPHCQGAAFAVGDAVLAVRLQIRHFRSWGRLLPLLAWHDGERARTQHAWQLLAGRRLVLWAWRMGPEVLAQAIAADGRLVLAGPEYLHEQAIDHYLRQDPPHLLLRRLHQRALPWREAVQRWAASASDGAVRELLLGLGRYPLDRCQLAQDCGGGRLEELLPVAAVTRSVCVGGRTVVEREDGWYRLGRGGELVPLIHAVLRIDRVVRSAEPVRYVGRILFAGEEVAFEVVAAELEAQPGRWLRSYLLRRGKGVLHLAPGLRGLIEIALKFHEPLLD